jgi:hypothetical protein
MATGIVSWINPPENKGKITRTDDGSNEVYEYAINTGSTVDGFIPKMGDIVIFLPGSGKTATGIEKQPALALGITSFTLEGTLLSWETAGAASGYILPEIGEISDRLPNGSTTALNSRITSYTLTISDGTREISAPNS